MPLQIEHIVPRSRTGTSNRIWNLCLACQDCNQRKGNQTAAEFGFPELHKEARRPLKDAAAVNSTRKVLVARLEATGIPLTTGTGGQTKFNRTQRGLPKTHWLDAACVGPDTPPKLQLPTTVLHIRATGWGNRQRCQTNAKGFPIRHRTRKKTFRGWKTGDMVVATIPKGKFAGTETGRITIRQRPNFRLNDHDVHPKYLRRIHRADGYEYVTQASSQALAASNVRNPA